MEPTDLSIEILKGIRDAVQGTNSRLDETNTRLDETNVRVGDLARRVVESELRTATALVELHGTVREAVTLMREQNDLRPRVDHCERAISDIKGRLKMG